jgi:hypothetical protein
LQAVPLLDDKPADAATCHSARKHRRHRKTWYKNIQKKIWDKWRKHDGINKCNKNRFRVAVDQNNTWIVL